MTEHCIVQENDQAPIGDEEKEQNDQAPIGDEEQEQQQRSQIRKKEESKVLKLKVEKSTLWEEDTEKNLDKSENVSQIFTSDFSNSDSPNDDPDSQTEHDFGTIETEEETSRKLQNFLESFSSSCIDEVHNGKLVVDRKRAPLPDGSLQQLVDHSINKQVHRKDHERIPPVLSLSKPTKKKETIEQQTFEGRCRELGINREAGLRLLQDSKREGNSQDFWGTLKTEPASEQRLETDTGKLDRSSTLTRRKTRGASAGLLEIRNALKGEQRKLARKKRKEDSKKARTSSSDEGEVCDSDEVIARQLQEDEERLQMFHAQLSVVKEDAEDVARQWAEATPAEENAAEKPNQHSSDHVAPLPPLKASKNPFLLRDRHLTRSNLNKVPGVKMTKLAPSSSLKEAAASESPPREKGERRVKSAQVGSRNVKGKAVALTDWPRDRDLERMLHGKRKDIPPLPECPPLEFRKRTPEQAPVLTVNKSRNSDFGPSWTSPDTHFNLLSEAQLWMYGISIIKKTSGDEAGIYLKDASGERYPMHMVDKQFRIWVGFAHGDKVEKAEFIVDGGN